MRPAFLSTPLRYFLVVAQLGSVSAAAEQLHVAASAISRQLSKLEDSLGLVLFERKQRGMALTAAGVQLATQLRAAAEEVDRLIDQVQGVVQQRSRQVRVACTEGFAPGFMPGVMNHFRQQMPDVQFQLTVAHPKEVTSLVLRGQADLAIKYSVAPERGLHAHLSVLAPVQAIVLPDHPLARRKSLRIADVVRYPLVMPTTGNTGRDLFDLSCSIQGLHYQVKVESNFSSALLSLVIDQDVLLAAEITVAHLLKSGHMVAVPFADGEMQQRRLQMLTAEGVVASPAVQAFMECVQAAIASGGA